MSKERRLINLQVERSTGTKILYAGFRGINKLCHMMIFQFNMLTLSIKQDDIHFFTSSQSQKKTNSCFSIMYYILSQLIHATHNTISYPIPHKTK